MTKKERVLAAIEKKSVDHVPACFSLHFPPEIAHGAAAVQAHLDFFRQTDADVHKIMNENLVPPIEGFDGPGDWARIPAYDRHSPFIKRQLELIRRVLDGTGGDGYALATIHGVCASAIHPIEMRYGYDGTRKLQAAHYRSNKALVRDAFQRLADAMSDFAVATIEEGARGIYYAALGGEARYFTDEEFSELIEPLDRQVLSAVRQAGGHVFLHICKEKLVMERYRAYGDLVDVVNWGVFEAPCTLTEGRALFPEATIMGGLKNRSGVMVEGAVDDLVEAVRALIDSVGEKGFILGADCTLPTEIPYERIMAAVHAAIR